MRYACDLPVRVIWPCHTDRCKAAAECPRDVSRAWQEAKQEEAKAKALELKIATDWAAKGKAEVQKEKAARADKEAELVHARATISRLEAELTSLNAEV